MTQHTNPAKYIYSLLERERNSALRNYIGAVTDYEGAKAAKIAWDERNGPCLGPPIGRPEPELKQGMVETTSKKLDDVEEIMKWFSFKFMENE